MTERLTRRIGVGVMLIGLVVGFALWWGDVARTQRVRLSAPALVETAEPTDAGTARTLARALLGAIVAAPLDQDLVNRFYTLASTNRLVGGDELAAWRTQVGRLGWRTNAAQQNLLLAAAYANDLPTILDRTDAMMRRERFVEQLIVLLYTIEQAPETHDVLVGRLEDRVPWRATFFADPRGVIAPAGRQARLATIREMLAGRHAVARAEIAPLLVAMDAAGDDGRAFRLWRRLHAQDPRQPRLATGETFDPDFAAFRAVQRSGPVGALPFEWQAMSGDGYSADVADDGVTLHWDGNGVPTLLRQVFQAKPGRYRMSLTGTDATPDILNRFEFVAQCPQGEALFTVVRRGQDGEFSVDSDRPLSCSFPVLLVRGRASMVSQPVDASLTSILLRPVIG